MLANLNDILPRAKEGAYAVGLFNTVNLEMAKGVIFAAEELCSPIIIGTAEVLLPSASLEELASFLIPLAKTASVPVVVHFDHGLTLEKVHLAMELGFTSVMCDCSTLDFDSNCRAVARVTREAHLRGVTVEAELGHVGANEAGGESQGAEAGSYTDPKQALEFYHRTDVDALAVAIGTAHGTYKAAPKLDIPRLGEIARVVPVPLVLHGGSGLSEPDFRVCIEHGISKVNIFTDINCASAKAAHDAWKPGAGMTDLMQPVINSVKQAAMEKMNIFGSGGHGRACPEALAT